MKTYTKNIKTHIKVAKHHINLYAKEAAYKFNNIPSFETVMLCLISKCGEKSVDRLFSAFMW
ncbi:hypothetical protein [Spiroplasma endosymbiont of Virgichneumon dumeticola]|uniref:hypothetical protein n=1 Tax=Spiroplasma endosymbiont of Virgichneumon dumeticola TaxID=3139323 RepID=UPI0035C903F9